LTSYASSSARAIAAPEASAHLQPSENPFALLGLAPHLVRAVADEGYTQPTPIQSATIPHVLAGRDVLGCAQTGTGKTAAFVLPLLQRLAAAPRAGKHIRLLVLTPTRELAAQIDERVAAYGRHLGVTHTVIFGGVNQHRQEIALARHPDVLVATPGRLLDLMDQRLVRLDGVTQLVLDEADRMLDMGFIRDVRAICAAVPKKRQTLLFSATMPAEVAGLANAMLVDPARVSVTPKQTAATTVSQSVMHVSRDEKRRALVSVLSSPDVVRAIVFTRTKRGANRVTEQLARAGVEAAAIHGNKSQNARERALGDFKSGRARVLVATDVASRGIDVDGVSHVINYELPETPESYVHRIGRTGRAGAEGSAISFCDHEERPLLAQIERLLARRLPVASLAGGDVAMAAPVRALAVDAPAPARERPAPEVPGIARDATSRRRFQARKKARSYVS